MSEDHDPRIDRLEENVREVKAILKDLGSQISHIEQKLATTRTDEKLASAAEVTATRAEIEKLRQDVADKPDKSWLPTVAGLVLLAYAIGGIWASFVAVFFCWVPDFSGRWQQKVKHRRELNRAKKEFDAGRELGRAVREGCVSEDEICYKINTASTSVAKIMGVAVEVCPERLPEAGRNQLVVATQPGGRLRWQGDGGRIERYGTS